MPEDFTRRLERLTQLQTDFARLLRETVERHISAGPLRACWIHVDAPAGHGKSAVLRKAMAAGSESRGAWIEGRPESIHREVLAALARHAGTGRRLELRGRAILAAAPGVLAQPYLPASLLVLAVLLVLSDPRSLSPWGFLLAGAVAVLSIVASWTGRDAPRKLVRPALRRAWAERGGRFFLFLDDLDLASPAVAMQCLDELRALTDGLHVAVMVACERGWLAAAMPAAAGLPTEPADQAAIARYFDLSITVPLVWPADPVPAEENGGEELAPGVEMASPRLLLRHRLATTVLRAIYGGGESAPSSDAISRWALLCLRWPSLAAFLSAYPARVAHFRYEQQPPEAPPEIASYFSDPGVARLLRTPGDKPALDEATLRALLAPFPPRRPPVV